MSDRTIHSFSLALTADQYHRLAKWEDIRKFIRSHTLDASDLPKDVGEGSTVHT